MRKHIAVILLCIAPCAHARHNAESADSTSTILDEVVVTSAPRTAVSTAPLREADAAQMLRTGVTDVAQALRRMPGVNLRDYGGAGGLKTVSVRGFGAAHTGVTYDGIPLSDVQTGQIDLARYSVDNVKSVGMVIGDNADIFVTARSAASASTVSISTTPAPKRPALCAKMRVGSYGYYNPYINIATPIGDKVTTNISGDYTYAENDYKFILKNGNITTHERRTNSRMSGGHAEMNLRWQPSPTTSLSTKIYGYGNSRQLPGPVIYYNNVGHEHLKEQNVMAQTLLRTKISGTIALQALAKWNFASSMYHDEGGKYPGGTLDQNYWQREYYTSMALLYNPTAHWLIDYSADYFHNSLNSNLISDRRPYRNSLLQSLTAKYSSRRLTVMARLLTSVYLNGARTGTAAKDATRLSPSASVSYQPWRSQMLYLRASYKNIFRMPTFNEAYFDHYGSAEILPEATNQLNIGATYTVKASQTVPLATFTVDAYTNRIRDMIVAVPYNMFIWRMVNLGKVRAYGVDATADVTVTVATGHDLSLSANYSYQRVMPVTDPASSEWHKQVAYIPRHSGSAAISYENPWVNMSVSATACSNRYTTSNNLPTTRIAGYAEVTATLWRQVRIKSVLVDLRAEALNLLDKQYCIVARYPMPGRQYRLTVALSPKL